MSSFPLIQPQVDCTTADEFLDAISPIGPNFKRFRLADPWVFRGQSGDFPLVPSAYRSDDRLRRLTGRKILDSNDRDLAIRDIVIRYFEIADRRGLILPDDSQQLREKLETLNSERGNFCASMRGRGWEMHSNALSLMALAQHFGIPTPLLDWSRQPLTAAFFAAEKAACPGRQLGDLSHIVVWALYFPLMGKQDSVNSENDVIRIVTAPSATNSNLKAQQGVFSLFRPQPEGKSYRENQPMEEYFARIASDLDPDNSTQHKIISQCALKKFTLPASQSDSLLYLLAKMDVTPSAIYPGYAAIIQDLEQDSRFSRPEGDTGNLEP